MNKLYVFRFAIGEPDEPVKSCPLSFYRTYESELKKKLNNYSHTAIDYDNYQEFLWKELFAGNRLRQGWGFEGLDLSVIKHFGDNGKDYWIRNFIISQQKIGKRKTVGDEKKWCSKADGRLNILKYMLSMKKGDILFIPKIWSGDNKSYQLENKLYFTVATVKDTYYFDYPIKIGEFSHTIGVENIQTFEYGKHGIKGVNFRPYPYRRAISVIHSEGDFRKFINSHYLSSK